MEVLPSQESFTESNSARSRHILLISLVTMVVFSTVAFAYMLWSTGHRSYTGPYRLVQQQTGQRFLDYYDFLDGPDSLGSAGYNRYVSQKRALDLGILNVTDENIYLSSAATEQGPRESIRLEGKRRFNRGLFVLDVEHMPAGCGVWPAFWLTDEDAWPENGEIDVVEGINTQTVAKTALHTSESCSMYAHVAPYWHTGVWDTAEKIPNTWTGALDNYTRVVADNCWILAPHQWANQGCVAIETRPNTIGAGFNEQGGGVYVLEWDPASLYIRSWVFPRSEGLPENLQAAMTDGVRPDPSQWTLPYAYFAIGPTTGCSADHFRNMRIVFNLAFCGTVAGNRFGRDCPALTQDFGQAEDPSPVNACNRYIASDPSALSEAYWKIKGVWVYEREKANDRAT